MLGGVRRLTGIGDGADERLAVQASFPSARSRPVVAI
jgi:hypothetical protein